MFIMYMNNLDFNTDNTSSYPSSARITNKLHPQNIALNPNIHIHNKHAPSSSSLSHLTYADTPPHPPPPPQPPHAPPPQHPHVSENPSTLTHAQVDIYNTKHNVSTNTNHNVSTNTNTNANIGNNLEIKETDGTYMDYNNLVENDYINPTPDNNLDFNIDNTSSYTTPTQNTNQLTPSKIEDWEKKEHEWIENVQSDLNHAQPPPPPPVLRQIEYKPTHTQSTFQLPQPYRVPTQLEYNIPMHLTYPNPMQLEYNTPASIEYNQPAPIEYNQPATIQYTKHTPIEYNQSPTHALVPASVPAPAFTHALAPTLTPAPAPAPTPVHTLAPISAPTNNLQTSQSCDECNQTELPMITRDKRCDKTKITFKCTLCDTDFAKKSSLMRHNKRFHEAFHQIEKGIKRKSNFEETHNKRFKSTRGEKRKLGVYSVPSLGWIEQKR